MVECGHREAVCVSKRTDFFHSPRLPGAADFAELLEELSRRSAALVGYNTRRACGAAALSRGYLSLEVELPEWRVSVLSQPVSGRHEAPRHRLDLSLPPRVPEAELSVWPHGLIGQSFDGDGAPLSGRVDDYSAGVVHTSAMAEGAIEGTADDYRVPTAFSAAFCYSRLGALPGQTRPRDAAAIGSFWLVSRKGLSPGTRLSHQRLATTTPFSPGSSDSICASLDHTVRHHREVPTRLATHAGLLARIRWEVGVERRVGGGVDVTGQGQAVDQSHVPVDRPFFTLATGRVEHRTGMAPPSASALALTLKALHQRPSAQAGPWPSLLHVPEAEMRLLERVATEAHGCWLQTYKQRSLKGLMLGPGFIMAADAQLPGAAEFAELPEELSRRSAALVGQPELELLTVELSDQRVGRHGHWHVDTEQPGSLLNVIVPLDAVTAANGRTQLGNLADGPTNGLGGRRGQAYAFRGCCEHRVEGNSAGSDRRLLVLVLRPGVMLREPNIETAKYRRVQAAELAELAAGRSRRSARSGPARPGTVRQSARLLASDGDGRETPVMTRSCTTVRVHTADSPSRVANSRRVCQTPGGVY